MRHSKIGNYFAFCCISLLKSSISLSVFRRCSILWNMKYSVVTVCTTGKLALFSRSRILWHIPTTNLLGLCSFTPGNCSVPFGALEKSVWRRLMDLAFCLNSVWNFSRVRHSSWQLLRLFDFGILKSLFLSFVFLHDDHEFMKLP